MEEADLLVTMETGPVSLKISLAQWAEVGSRAVQREAEDTARNGGAEWPHWERADVEKSQEVTTLQFESKASEHSLR